MAYVDLSKIASPKDICLNLDGLVDVMKQVDPDSEEVVDRIRKESILSVGDELRVLLQGANLEEAASRISGVSSEVVERVVNLCFDAIYMAEVRANFYKGELAMNKGAISPLLVVFFNKLRDGELRGLAIDEFELVFFEGCSGFYEKLEKIRDVSGKGGEGILAILQVRIFKEYLDEISPTFAEDLWANSKKLFGVIDSLPCDGDILNNVKWYVFEFFEKEFGKLVENAEKLTDLREIYSKISEVDEVWHDLMEKFNEVSSSLQRAFEEYVKKLFADIDSWCEDFDTLGRLDVLHYVLKMDNAYGVMKWHIEDDSVESPYEMEHDCPGVLFARKAKKSPDMISRIKEDLSALPTVSERIDRFTKMKQKLGEIGSPNSGDYIVDDSRKGIVECMFGRVDEGVFRDEILAAGDLSAKFEVMKKVDSFIEGTMSCYPRDYFTGFVPHVLGEGFGELRDGDGDFDYEKVLLACREILRMELVDVQYIFVALFDSILLEEGQIGGFKAFLKDKSVDDLVKIIGTIDSAMREVKLPDPNYKYFDVFERFLVEVLVGSMKEKFEKIADMLRYLHRDFFQKLGWLVPLVEKELIFGHEAEFFAEADEELTCKDAYTQYLESFELSEKSKSFLSTYVFSLEIPESEVGF